jgi:hypothetical protein
MISAKNELEYLCEQTENTVGDVVIASTELQQFLGKYGCPIDSMNAETFQKNSPNIYAEAREFGNKLSFSTATIYIVALAEILYERIK